MGDVRCGGKGQGGGKRANDHGELLLHTHEILLLLQNLQLRARSRIQRLRQSTEDTGCRIHMIHNSQHHPHRSCGAADQKGQDLLSHAVWLFVDSGECAAEDSSVGVDLAVGRMTGGLY